MKISECKKCGRSPRNWVPHQECGIGPMIAYCIGCAPLKCPKCNGSLQSEGKNYYCNTKKCVWPFTRPDDWKAWEDKRSEILIDLENGKRLQYNIRVYKMAIETTECEKLDSERILIVKTEKDGVKKVMNPYSSSFEVLRDGEMKTVIPEKSVMDVKFQ